MPYLALAVADESELGAVAGKLTIEPRIASAVQRELGNTVLLYRRTDDEVISFFARARLMALRAVGNGGRHCELEPLHWFATTVADAAAGSVPGARRSLTLTAERFGEVMASAGVKAIGEFAEITVAARWRMPTAPEDLLRIHNQVMQRWSYRCAVTDVQFAPSEGLHPHLRLVAIRPMAFGGPLDARNFLPMVELAERAWASGVISVGPGLDILVTPNRLEPDLLAAMPQDGRLIVPANPAEGPDADHLAFHRTRIFGVFHA